MEDGPRPPLSAEGFPDLRLVNDDFDGVSTTGERRLQTWVESKSKPCPGQAPGRSIAVGCWSDGLPSGSFPRTLTSVYTFFFYHEAFSNRPPENKPQRPLPNQKTRSLGTASNRALPPSIWDRHWDTWTSLSSATEDSEQRQRHTGTQRHTSSGLLARTTELGKELVAVVKAAVCLSVLVWSARLC